MPINTCTAKVTWIYFFVYHWKYDHNKVFYFRLYAAGINIVSIPLARLQSTRGALKKTPVPIVKPGKQKQLFFLNFDVQGNEYEDTVCYSWSHNIDVIFSFARFFAIRTLFEKKNQNSLVKELVYNSSGFALYWKVYFCLFFHSVMFGILALECNVK